MRSDCITECISNGIRDKCGLNCINWLNNSRLIRESDSRNYYAQKICDISGFGSEERSCVRSQTMSLEFKCADRCRADCQEVFYDFEVIKHFQIHRRTLPYDVLSLRFVHRDGPDMIISHRPTMKWIELVCSFGGLSGMWLGVSFVLIIDHLVVFIARLYDKNEKC